jgi:Protein of unknown function (DUF2442)
MPVFLDKAQLIEQVRRLSRLVGRIRDIFAPRVYGPEPMIHVTTATPIGGYRLRLTFSNGDKGEINLANHVVFIGTLAPLADERFFRQVFVARGTLCWPGDIDMDSTVIHHLTMGIPIELLSTELPSTPVNHSPAPARTR